tara:strand:- start:696 stop:1400 length:705 start_codon:yes stop_codon:yes gene_type:complete
MIEEIDFETFLYVSNEKYQVSVFDKKKLKNLYNEELKFGYKFNSLDFNSLTKFLDENIYKIEKSVGDFVKNIILIIESDKNLNVNISIKKKLYDNFLSQKHLENNLIELKDLYKENYQDQSIMHMIMINNTNNDEKYSRFNNNVKGKNFFLEVNFISISNELIISLNKNLEKYQIKVSQYMCGNYIKNFFDNDQNEISLKAHKLINGQNVNEVALVAKDIENKGFFEKFFQLFS